MSKSPDHVNENQRYWDAMADQWISGGERAWASRVPYWGNWGVPNDECPMLPEDMTGMTAIELGCGTGYVSAWMARRGASVTAIDNSERQLATARRLASEYHIDIDFLHGNAESVPGADGKFDFAISEYGAAIWCDPEAWIPEAHRLLTPGGKLVFLGNSPLAMICTPMDGAPVDRALHRDYLLSEDSIGPGSQLTLVASSSICRCRHGSLCSAASVSALMTTKSPSRPSTNTVSSPMCLLSGPGSIQANRYGF